MLVDLREPAAAPSLNSDNLNQLCVLCVTPEDQGH